MDFENNEMEELDNIIVLNDEDGKEVQFEFLDLIEYDEEEYVVLLPIEDEASEEVVILKVEDTDSDEEESYVSVDDEEVLNSSLNFSLNISNTVFNTSSSSTLTYDSSSSESVSSTFNITTSSF